MTADQFEAVTAHLPYVARGMFLSEVYLFASLCLAAGVVRIVESGVRNGMSTRVLRAIWPGRVQSVEFRPANVPADLRADLIVGNGLRLVPALIASHGTDAVGILLDGPKGDSGDTLRHICLARPNVRVVGQHDSPRGRGETHHSTDLMFRRAVGERLDARIPVMVRAQYADGCPGLGVWVR